MQAVDEKAKHIRLLLLDVDGVLTTGVIYYGNHAANNDEIEFKGFHVHDGLGMKLLQRTGIQLGVISAKNSPVVLRRLNYLKVDHIKLGHEEKLPVYEALKQELQLTDNQIAYIGDDFPDLPILRRAGLAVTVPTAPLDVKQYVDYVTEKKPGKGAVREVCELIMHAQGSYQSVLNSYLSY